jgi:hypothetical protein
MLGERHTCGRPTKNGTPCGQRRYQQAPACNRHITDEERAEDQRRVKELREGLAGYRPPVGKPDCWSWPVAEADRQDGSIARWQAGRCAVCGERGQLVADHDHGTGWVRGLLCRGCNLAETQGHRLYDRYRRWCPAKILDVWRRYHSPFTGLDFGRWANVEIEGPVPVTSGGVVLFVGLSDAQVMRRNAELSAVLEAMLGSDG